MGKPGPKPRRPRAVQSEAFDAQEMRGQGPGFFTSVDRLVQRCAVEYAQTCEALAQVGWAMVSGAEGWRAHSRQRERTVRAATAQGLLRQVYAIEAGGALEQLELLPRAGEAAHHQPMKHPAAPVALHPQGLALVG